MFPILIILIILLRSDEKTMLAMLVALILLAVAVKVADLLEHKNHRRQAALMAEYSRQAEDRMMETINTTGDEEEIKLAEAFKSRGMLATGVFAEYTLRGKAVL